MNNSIKKALPLLLAGLFVSGGIFAQCNENIRIAKPDGIYLDNGDGTVSDRETGLIWAKCALGLRGGSCADGLASMANWKDALELTQTANIDEYLGQDDWRMPSVAELRTLVEKACYSPAINENLFPNTGSGLYWTSSPDTIYRGNAVMIEFNNGSESRGSLKAPSAQLPRVRLVRGGHATSAP